MGNMVLDGDTLRVSGRLGIQDAVQLRDLLQAACEKSMRLELDLAGVESLDLACVQVLCSANRTCRKAGKEIHPSCPVPAGVRKSLNEMALDPGRCSLESLDDCLWGAGDGK
jgi:ABC-type transporter Mla MlaB component